MKIPLNAAIHLLHEAPHAVLATNSTQFPGYPYATAIPLVVDVHHQPILLISALAEHTKNLLADPRASLAIVENGKSNPQNAARMTLVGIFEYFNPSQDLVARYLRYQPEVEQYLQLDFMFFRLNIERVRFIAGIGQMGWFDSTDWSSAQGIGADVELKLLADAECRVPSGVRLVGFDTYGVDYEVEGLRRRRRFEDAITSETIAQEMGKIITMLSHAKL